MESDCIFSNSKVGLFYNNTRPLVGSEAGGFAARSPTSDGKTLDKCLEVSMLLSLAVPAVPSTCWLATSM